MSPDQELETIYYFSAFSAADAYDKIKHQRYIEALKTEGIKIIMGEYQKVTRKFSKKMPIIYVEHISDPLIPYTIKQKCIPEKIHYKNFEEKRTDVNIATRIVADAFLSTCDDMMIITGDSDIAPAIYMVKRYCKEIRITSVLPIKSK
ncbi:NYN domain-containing protein [Patescibacteria group bacterium]|nr:NYN domain-containing protein [Patescibacteria group bacterium]